MHRRLFAPAFALSVLPVTALAQNTNAPPPLTDQQKQAVQATFQRYRAQEEQLHQQLRYQVLSALTPAHRRELASLIGELSIEPNPDIQVAAERIDRALLSSEHQRILAAQQSFEAQSRQLHEQMRTELQSELPAHPNGENGRRGWAARMPRRQLSAGAIVLMTLTPHLPMEMGMRGGREMMRP
ncbi:MAG TPA: hypothetical protein VGI19_07135 [Candidatus Cybelea sp.]|jgi:hypothetical protein